MTTAPISPSRIPALSLAAPETFQALSYLDFVYGFGAGPGLDLGVPLRQHRAPTETGCVYRQDFERAIAYANLGDEGATVVLDLPYYDRTGTLLAALYLEPRAVEVLYPAAG